MSPCVFSEDSPFVGEQAYVTQKLLPSNVWVDRLVRQRRNYLLLIDALMAAAPVSPGCRHVPPKEARHQCGHDFPFTPNLHPAENQHASAQIAKKNLANEDFQNIQRVL